MGILKYWLNVARDRLREVTAELPLLLSMSIPLFCKPYLTHALEISLYRDCIPASSPQNPAFLSVLHWQSNRVSVNFQPLCFNSYPLLQGTWEHTCSTQKQDVLHVASGISCIALKAFITTVAPWSFSGSNFPVWCPSVQNSQLISTCTMRAHAAQTPILFHGEAHILKMHLAASGRTVLQLNFISKIHQEILKYKSA